MSYPIYKRLSENLLDEVKKRRLIITYVSACELGESDIKLIGSYNLFIHKIPLQKSDRFHKHFISHKLLYWEN
jgi:hypothetical protein